MTIVIDGHNLIGAGVFKDIHLSDEDDEAKLVARLRVWRSRMRRKIIVYFDRGVSGGRDHRMSGGGVEVVFASNPTEADDLIRQRLRKSSRHNTILVSNDDALAQVAGAHGIERWRGQEFVARMAIRIADAPAPEAGEEWDVRLSKEEVEEWLEIFRAAQRARRARRAAAAQANRGSDDKSRTPSKPRRNKTSATDATLSGGANGASKSSPKDTPLQPELPKKAPRQSQRKTRQAARNRNRLGPKGKDR